MAFRTRALIIFALDAAILELDNSTSAAMTFTPTTDGEIIRAEGPIEPGDAERLRSLVTLTYLQWHGLVRFGATLNLNSPGGSVVGAIELANAIRERRLMTHVAAEAECYSACTIAFLGGTKRTVLGKFGIHAMSMARGADAQGNDLDNVQFLSGTLMTVAQSLVGDARLITGMLAIPASEIRLVPDAMLADWHVITIASRPSQRMKTSFNCGLPKLTTVEGMVCDHLVLADADQRMSAAYQWLLKQNAVRNLKQDQDRWRAYRNACPNVLGPNGDLDIVACLWEAYDVRVKQLEGLKTFHEASAAYPASKGWQPYPPIEEQLKSLGIGNGK